MHGGASPGRWSAVLGVVLGLAFSSSARAQAPDARDAEARALFQAGVSAFEAGRFEDALDRFEAAYEMSPRPELLYNLGTAADRLRRDETALSYFRAYLDQSTSPARGDEVRARIAALERSLAERNALERAAAQPPTAPAEGSAPPASGGQITDQWWFWAAVIGGGVLVAGGITIGAVVGSQPQQQPLLDGQVGVVVFALEVRR